MSFKEASRGPGSHFLTPPTTGTLNSKLNGHPEPGTFGKRLEYKLANYTSIV